MENSSNKSYSQLSRASQRSSFSSLSSFAGDSPKKRKKTDRMIYSIDKTEFEWSQTRQKEKSIKKQRNQSSSPQSKFQNYLSDNLSDDTQSFKDFFGKSLKRTKLFSQSRRRINSEPFKKATVPNWRDNFYTNLLDWNHENIIFAAVDHEILQFTMDSFDSKESKVFVWPWMKGTRINAIKCSPANRQTAIAYDNGSLQVYDYSKKKALCLDILHSGRITALDWSEQSILTGSKDKTIKMIDDRTFKSTVNFFEAHRQQVLGIKRCGNLVASGGNDNVVAIFDIRRAQKLLDSYEHEAAVKSLAWVEESKILISGGGTSDKMIKFWNHKEMKIVKEIETGSQICNLIVSKNTKQFVSCQGFSQNQVILWNMEGGKVQILHGKHSARVLYCSLSPSGQYLATGAGDKKLLIWKMFPCPQRKNRLLDKADLR